jgi:hypothetical protein
VTILFLALLLPKVLLLRNTLRLVFILEVDNSCG